MRARRVTLYLGCGTHLPVLMRAVDLTMGPIAELGAGIFSTPYLHAVAASCRPVTTYERDPAWLETFADYRRNPWHALIPVTEWADVDLERTDQPPWSVVLIDHEPALQRRIEIARLADRADLIVVHDTEGRRERDYQIHDVLESFAHRADYRAERPHTTVVSNWLTLDAFEDLCVISR